MSLENLLAIRQLEKLEASRDALLKLLSAAGRSIADAKIKAVSAEIRFDAAYERCVSRGMRTAGGRPAGAREPPGRCEMAARGVR